MSDTLKQTKKNELKSCRIFNVGVNPRQIHALKKFNKHRSHLYIQYSKHVL